MASEHEWRDCFHPTTQQGGDGCHFFMRCHGIWPERCDLSERDHRESDAEKIERLMASERQHPDMTIEEELGHAMIARAEMEMMWAESHDEVQRLRTLLAERDARIKTLENDLEHALASVGAFRQAVENVFAKAEEHEVDQGGMIVTYVLPCGPLHRAIGLTRGTDAGGKLLKRLGDTEAERDDLAARMAAAEAAIREALYDYDHGDDLGAIDRLRAALAAQEGRDDLPTE